MKTTIKLNLGLNLIAVMGILFLGPWSIAQAQEAEIDANPAVEAEVSSTVPSTADASSEKNATTGTAAVPAKMGDVEEFPLDEDPPPPPPVVEAPQIEELPPELKTTTPEVEALTPVQNPAADPQVNPETTTPNPTAESETDPSILVERVSDYQAPKSDIPAGEIPKVEIEASFDSDLPYRERRGRWGLDLSLGAQQLFPEKFISTLDSAPYLSKYNSNISMSGLSILPKVNFGPLSLALGPHYYSGSLTAGASTLKLMQKGLSVRFNFDGIFKEPWCVVYGGVDAWTMDINESSGTQSFSATTKVGQSIVAGAKFLVNWADEDTSLTARKSYGIENTFINVYAVSYAKSSAAGDADLTSGAQLAGALSFEF